MRISVYFDGFAAIAEMLGAAAAAEGAGASALWFAQHMGYRDAFVGAATAAGVTRRAELVPTAISIYTWPPLQTAMSIASLDDAAPGRAALAIAVGNMLNLAELGFEPVKPLQVMREYVQALRALLDGQPVHLDGVANKLSGAHLTFRTSRTIPILVASTGPKMLQLAGEIGDGVVFSTGLTIEFDALLSRGGRGRCATARWVASDIPQSRLHQSSRFRGRGDRALRGAAEACSFVPQQKPCCEHQIIRTRHRPRGDHGRQCPP